MLLTLDSAVRGLDDQDLACSVCRFLELWLLLIRSVGKGRLSKVPWRRSLKLLLDQGPVVQTVLAPRSLERDKYWGMAQDKGMVSAPIGL